MSMMCLASCSCEQILEAPICGGATGSIFPQVEQWLLKDDHEHALRKLARTAKDDSYRSVIDFVFCSCFPDHVDACKAFYAGTGPQLNELVSEPQRAVYERWMLCVLRAGYNQWAADRRRSWKRMIRHTEGPKGE